MENSENISSENAHEQEETQKKLEKGSFHFRKDKNGLLLTIHHTIRENNNAIRIRLVVGCFNDVTRQFVTIDKRGTIFVFDMGKRKYWKIVEKVPKPYIIRNIPINPNIYIIGTRDGNIYWLDIDKSSIIHQENYSTSRISSISFPGIELKPYLAVVQSNHEAILLNLETFQASHRLEFNQAKVSLKFVAYIPQTEHIFTCFTNDSIHIWSGITLNTIEIHHPIRTRDRYLMIKVPKSIRLNDEGFNDKFKVNCEEIKEFSRGLINSFAFSLDGTVLCLTTLDNYIMLLSSVNYSLIKLIKVEDATVDACWLFPKPNDHVILFRTTKSQLYLLDVQHKDLRMIVEDENCYRADVSKDREMLAAVKKTGEVNIYCLSTLIDYLKSAQDYAIILREAISQPKGVSVGCFDTRMRKILTRGRLLPILREYGCYPTKYRNLIWVALLDLPCNKPQFMELIKMETHPSAAEFDKNLELKDTRVRRNLVKIFSCLGHWSKVFAHSDMIPGFIFPFIKVFTNSLTVSFEIIATILMNHCQLWFEFHPLEPLNYLGMCENILNHFDPELATFYKNIDIKPIEYAWAMLSNAFSEVLEEQEWLQLWDNVLSCPPYLLVFCAVAYNIVMRATIMRMETKEDIADFFHEQNPIDMRKFLKKTYCLLSKCPSELHPQQFMNDFEKLPRGVYPKFQKFPKKWMEAQENEVDILRREQELIDEKIRELDQEETLMIERLERGLKREEHAKRVKAMQVKYQDILKREEERLNYQRKMLLLYQKEQRQRKGKVLKYLESSTNRKKEDLQEIELLDLLRDVERGRLKNEMDLKVAEENLRDHELRLLSHQYGIDDLLEVNDYQPLKSQLMNAIDKLASEKAIIKSHLENMVRDGEDKREVADKLNQIESALQDIEKEFQGIQAKKS